MKPRTPAPIPEDFDTAPRHRKRRPKPRQKKYGIQQWSEWHKEWGLTNWYATEKARDQALDDLKRHTCAILKQHGHDPQYRKVNRCCPDLTKFAATSKSRASAPRCAP